jgi:adenylate cyclase
MTDHHDHQTELERRIFHLKTLYDVSQEIVFLRTPEEILQNLLMMVIGTFGTFKGVAVLADIENQSIEACVQRGMSSSTTQHLSHCVNSGRFHELTGVSEVISLVESCLEVKESDSEEVINSFHDLEIWIPFEVNEHLKGGVGLGAKLSGDPYTSDDEELLTTLSSQGAVTIENAHLIQQMKREEIVRANLARYLSPQIVEQIITKDVEVNLGGSRKTVTVLFSDIREFTSLTETRPPKELVVILNEYFTEMAKIIFDNQGSLDKYIGDAIVAVFGSLIPLENAAQNAVCAAIDMMRKMPELNSKWSEQFEGFTMDIGIGINTGEVFLGNIGSPERMEFTVIGDTINVASRFSDLAEPGQILTTGETVVELGDRFKCMSLPPSRVKGKSSELEVFEISLDPYCFE